MAAVRVFRIALVGIALVLGAYNVTSILMEVGSEPRPSLASRLPDSIAPPRFSNRWLESFQFLRPDLKSGER